MIENMPRIYFIIIIGIFFISNLANIIGFRLEKNAAQQTAIKV